MSTTDIVQKPFCPKITEGFLYLGSGTYNNGFRNFGLDIYLGNYDKEYYYFYQEVSSPRSARGSPNLSRWISDNFRKMDEYELNMLLEID